MIRFAARKFESAIKFTFGLMRTLKSCCVSRDNNSQAVVN